LSRSGDNLSTGLLKVLLALFARHAWNASSLSCWEKGPHCGGNNRLFCPMTANQNPIAQNRPDDYLSSHPTTADILLLIEIADSSLSYDKQVKLPLYAEAGISDYWIFNLLETCLECYSDPYQNSQGKFGYRLKRIFLSNETVALPNFGDLSLDLSKVFPPSFLGE